MNNLSQHKKYSSGTGCFNTVRQNLTKLFVHTRQKVWGLQITKNVGLPPHYTSEHLSPCSFQPCKIWSWDWSCFHLQSDLQPGHVKLSVQMSDSSIVEKNAWTRRTMLRLSLRTYMPFNSSRNTKPPLVSLTKCILILNWAICPTTTALGEILRRMISLERGVNFQR